MSSTAGRTASDTPWKTKEQGEEAEYARRKEQEQLAALRESMNKKEEADQAGKADKDFEGGFGGQEDLEDRYATTSGEH